MVLALLLYIIYNPQATVCSWLPLSGLGSCSGAAQKQSLALCFHSAFLFPLEETVRIPLCFFSPPLPSPVTCGEWGEGLWSRQESGSPDPWVDISVLSGPV